MLFTLTKGVWTGTGKPRGHPVHPPRLIKDRYTQISIGKRCILTGAKTIFGIEAKRSGTRAWGMLPTWLVNTGRWARERENIAAHTRSVRWFNKILDPRGFIWACAANRVRARTQVYTYIRTWARTCARMCYVRTSSSNGGVKRLGAPEL